MILEYFKIIGSIASFAVQIIIFLIALYVMWKNNKKDFKFIIYRLTEAKNMHAEETARNKATIITIQAKIDDQIVPSIAYVRENIQRNLQAIEDMKENCIRHNPHMARKTDGIN
jgi:hypothetical protein